MGHVQILYNSNETFLHAITSISIAEEALSIGIGPALALVVAWHPPMLCGKCAYAFLRDQACSALNNSCAYWCTVPTPVSAASAPNWHCLRRDGQIECDMGAGREHSCPSGSVPKACDNGVRPAFTRSSGAAKRQIGTRPWGLPAVWTVQRIYIRPDQL